jgi:hypothetical protein
MVNAAAVANTEIAPAGLMRPVWRRARLWVVLALVAIAGGAILATLSNPPGRLLDPTSAHKNGSKALARLLARYGTTVKATTSLKAALGSGAEVLLVAVPDDYSTEQLRVMSSQIAHLVLVQPGTHALEAVASRLAPDRGGVPSESPGCADPGAQAAGRVSFPDDTIIYAGPGVRCYGGAVVASGGMAVLGSAAMLTNASLADRGVAALDINTITHDRAFASVSWLLPGGDTRGPGPASIWDLFPGWTFRVFWVLIAVGALAALWRARRLGGVVPEPLPVIVRAAEVVEGHGRLYARAGARDRAADALRAAALARLGHRLGLPRGADAEQVGAAAAPIVGRPPAEVVAILSGTAPADDLALQLLARDLDAVESAVSGERTEGMST